MADTLLSPIQLNPPAGTLTAFYTATAATVFSSLTVCNTGGTSATFSLSVVVGGSDPDNIKQYIYSGVTIPAKSTFVATIGITLLANDTINVLASTPLLGFNMFGVKIA